MQNQSVSTFAEAIANLWRSLKYFALLDRRWVIRFVHSLLPRRCPTHRAHIEGAKA